MNPHLDDLQADFLNIWNDNKTRRFTEAELFDLNEYLEGSFEAAVTKAAELIPKHILLLEQATSCLFLLVRSLAEKMSGPQNAAFLSQLHRSVNCLIVIRCLLRSGLEEACRPVTRNYLESLDIALACLGDRKFAEELFGDNSVDFNVFWKQSIGYGKIYQFVRLSCHLAGLSDEEIEEHIQLRKAQKTLLSSSVHGDDSGAFRSMMVPLLGYPDFLSTEPHGVISLHTANHVATVIYETHKALSLILKILMSDRAPPDIVLPHEGIAAHTFFTHFLSFQELCLKYDLPDGDEVIAQDFPAIASNG